MPSIPLTPSVVFIAALGLSLFALVFISALRHLVASPKKMSRKAVAGTVALLLAFLYAGGVLDKPQDGGGEGGGGERGAATQDAPSRDGGGASDDGSDGGGDTQSRSADEEEETGFNVFEWLVSDALGLSGIDSYAVSASSNAPSAWVAYGASQSQVATPWADGSPVQKDAPLALSISPARAVFADNAHSDAAVFLGGAIGFGARHCEECTHDEATQHRQSMSRIDVLSGPLYIDPARTSRVWRTELADSTVIAWENMAVMTTNDIAPLSAQIELFRSGDARLRYRLPQNIHSQSLSLLGIAVGAAHGAKTNDWLSDGSLSISDGDEITLKPTSPGWALGKSTALDGVPDILKAGAGLNPATPIPDVLATNPSTGNRYIDDLVGAYARSYRAENTALSLNISYNPVDVMQALASPTMVSIDGHIFPLVPGTSYSASVTLARGALYTAHIAPAPGFEPQNASVGIAHCLDTCLVEGWLPPLSPTCTLYLPLFDIGPPPHFHQPGGTAAAFARAIPASTPGTFKWTPDGGGLQAQASPGGATATFSSGLKAVDQLVFVTLLPDYSRVTATYGDMTAGWTRVTACTFPKEEEEEEEKEPSEYDDDDDEGCHENHDCCCPAQCGYCHHPDEPHQCPMDPPCEPEEEEEEDTPDTATRHWLATHAPECGEGTIIPLGLHPRHGGCCACEEHNPGGEPETVVIESLASGLRLFANPNRLHQAAPPANVALGQAYWLDADEGSSAYDDMAMTWMTTNANEAAEWRTNLVTSMRLCVVPDYDRDGAISPGERLRRRDGEAIDYYARTNLLY
ncbi:MAG: hypothetical protein FWF84_08025, partial [Kiritimatiellaeota bacterium]|nr:hypothetical protein [Kiritimatiellota bacterium]